MEAREKRVPFMMSERELGAVDKWRFQSQVATRADALRRLCRLGLALDELVPDLETALAQAIKAATIATEKLGGEGAAKWTSEQKELYLSTMAMARVIAEISQKSKILRSEEYPDEKLQAADSERADVFQFIENFGRGTE
ncbi:hypothetical protein [Agrobacterium larrymoorei]|uniref:Uncharacterized protein n=1 Tax=Agrobacterium larrymoorei TaxID=160699 RepID=A0AAF0KF20_9HYPH|nr:hypothetical protein [Agrobacterium larrymoorei]WHA41652.1 hypothetical protein CFBP5477_003190 [Agrobacterium larrymoorei]